MKKLRLLVVIIGVVAAGLATFRYAHLPNASKPDVSTIGRREIADSSETGDDPESHKRRTLTGPHNHGKPEVYTNDEAGYRIIVPPQWQFTREIKGVDAALVLRKRPADFPLVTIETIRIPGKSDFHAMLKQVGQELTKRYDKVEFLKDEEVERNVYRALYRAETEGQKLMILQIFTKQGKWFAVLSAMDREKDFPRHEKDFQAVFAGIE